MAGYKKREVSCQICQEPEVDMTAVLECSYCLEFYHFECLGMDECSRDDYQCPECMQKATHNRTTRSTTRRLTKTRV